MSEFTYKGRWERLASTEESLLGGWQYTLEAFVETDKLVGRTTVQVETETALEFEKRYGSVRDQLESVAKSTLDQILERQANN